MYSSITATPADTDERVPTTSFPWLWIGFLFAAAFLMMEVLLVFQGVEDNQMIIYLVPISLTGMIYWLFCVYRLHKILAELTRGRYPVSPGEAALKHIIPFYNLYWVFKWPGEFSDYLTRRGRVRIISGSLLGVMLLLGMLVARLLDGAIGLAIIYGVTVFMSSKLKAHVKAVKGITPDQLPPLPDPRIFSQPIETANNPARETVEGSRAG
jgi:hypothetical protein